MKLNDPKKAIINITNGLEIDKKNANGFFQLGNAQMIIKEYESSLLSYQKAYKIKPSFWQAINNEALILYEINKKEKAIEKWREVLKLTQNGEPRLALAAALYETKKNKEISIELAQAALLNNPKYVSEGYQKEQLWGKKLRKSTQKLLSIEELKKNVLEAKAKSQ